MIIKDEKMLERFRERPCDACHKPPRSTAAHRYAKGHGGGHRMDVPENLCSLCGECHWLFDHHTDQFKKKFGEKKYKELHEIVGELSFYELEQKYKGK